MAAEHDWPGEASRDTGPPRVPGNDHDIGDDTGDGVVRANGIEIAYETLRRAGRPGVVLVMGLGRRCSRGRTRCAPTRAHGLYVVRFGQPRRGVVYPPGRRSPRRTSSTSRSGDGRRRTGSNDMATTRSDCWTRSVSERVHLVRGSMGGYIAQSLVLRHRSGCAVWC